jgi:hypothetical protein
MNKIRLQDLEKLKTEARTAYDALRSTMLEHIRAGNTGAAKECRDEMYQKLGEVIAYEKVIGLLE